MANRLVTKDVSDNIIAAAVMAQNFWGGGSKSLISAHDSDTSIVVVNKTGLLVPLSIGTNWLLIDTAINVDLDTNLDTGSKAALTQYYVYAVIDGSSLSFLISANAASPTGYTTSNSRCIGCFKTDAASAADATTIQPPPIWSSAMGVRDNSRNLIIANNTTYPNYKMDISADEVVLQDSSAISLRVRNISLTIDLTASGANGLDTGSEAVSVWYHLWVIAKADGTVAGLFSAAATAPTLPTGYAFKAYVGAVYNNASGNLNTLYQHGSWVTSYSNRILDAGTQTSITPISVVIIPPTAKGVFGCLSQGAAGKFCHLYCTNDSTCMFGHQWAYNAGYVNFYTRIIVPQTLYYHTEAGGLCYLDICGWEY